VPEQAQEGLPQRFGLLVVEPEDKVAAEPQPGLMAYMNPSGWHLRHTTHQHAECL
jgi:hypothetical protein